jgi:hypothetical protein
MLMMKKNLNSYNSNNNRKLNEGQQIFLLNFSGSNELFFSCFLIYILLKQYATESGIGTGFPTLFTRLLVGCQRFIEPVSHLFFINQFSR